MKEKHIDRWMPLELDRVGPSPQHNSRATEDMRVGPPQHNSSTTEDINIIWGNRKEKSLSKPFLMQNFSRSDLFRKSSLSGFKHFSTEEDMPNFSMIFHSGKAGSTLLKNMFGMHQNILALGEPRILSDIFSLLPSQDSLCYDEKLQHYKTCIKYFFDSMKGSEGHLIVKNTSILTPYISLFRKLFPRTYFIYVYRDPMEMIKSHLRTEISWSYFKSIPTETLNSLFNTAEDRAYLKCQLGLEVNEIADISKEEYITRVIGYHYGYVASMNDPYLIPLNYNSIKDKRVISKLVKLLQLPSAEGILSDIMGEANIYSKDKGDNRKVYTVDNNQNLDVSDERLSELADKYLVAPYAKLEKLSTLSRGYV